MDMAHNNIVISRVQFLPDNIVYLFLTKYTPLILCKQHKYLKFLYCQNDFPIPPKYLMLVW